MPRAALFDIDEALIDSVDLHAQAWHEAFVKFWHDVSLNRHAAGSAKVVTTSSRNFFQSPSKNRMAKN
jgi:beta-phosphoglucomutase-like phosphatase (HAD superfamily)